MDKANENESVIDFDDCIYDAPLEHPWKLLPNELQEAAKKLPNDQQHTVIKLNEEGTGHNESLITAAGLMYRMRVSYNDALKHLRDIYNPARRDYNTATERAVSRVWAADGDVSKLTSSDGESWSKADDNLLLKFNRLTPGEILTRSPSPRDISPLAIINDMFDADDVVNVQRSAMEYGTLYYVRDLDDATLKPFKFLNPATFKNVKGVPNTLDSGKISTRCNDNVKKREWIVLEIDSDTESENERFSSFAFEMAMFAPLKMVVDTGGKSLHFWFDARGMKSDNKSVKGFFNLACLHGADPRLAVKSQIARMPNVSAERDGRGEQVVLYYDQDGVNYPEKPWDLSGFDDHLSKNRQLLAYYHAKSASGSIYTEDDRKIWRALSIDSYKLHLATLGIRNSLIDGELLTPAQIAIVDTQTHSTIDGVFSELCGRHSGMYDDDLNMRYLVKRSPRLIKPRQGDWSTIERFLRGLFCNNDIAYRIFIAWLASSARDYRNDGKRISKFTQIQMIFLAGPPNAGKSLLLDRIISPCLSGRHAKADSLFQSNANNFNADTFSAELLSLDDSPVVQTNYSYRVEFSEKMKNYLVGSVGRLEMKGIDAISIRPWWRFVRCLNSDANNLSTLPLMVPGVEDKWILLKTQSLADHMPESGLPDWADKIIKTFENEMPAFLHYLLFEQRTSVDIADPGGRYPTFSYKDADLISEIDEESPESYLMERFDDDLRLMMFGDESNLKPWSGKPGELYELLMENGSKTQQERTRKICPNIKIFKALLKSLEKSERVYYSKRQDDGCHRWGLPVKKNGCEYWIVTPPASVDQGGIEYVEKTPFD